MMIKNASGEDLSIALARLNEKYNDNVIWNNYQQVEGIRHETRVEADAEHLAMCKKYSEL